MLRENLIEIDSLNTSFLTNEGNVHAINGIDFTEKARKPDPKAKSLPLQVCDPETNECGEPYVIYKLKMPEE